MIIRMPSAAEYALNVEKEQYWLPRLAPQLPLPIPTPIAMGMPGEGYPFHWSIYSWIDGETVALERISDLTKFATHLAQFLRVLQKIDATDGPIAGSHNFYRGGPLATYDAETRNAIAAFTGKIDTKSCTIVWNEALSSTWQGAPVWVHGDVAVGNLLVEKGSLGAVIDFGGVGIGDPACDLVMAWTFFKGESREAFRAALMLDSATLARARGWALWKALITCAEFYNPTTIEIENSRQVIDEVLEDYKHTIKTS